MLRRAVFLRLTYLALGICLPLLGGLGWWLYQLPDLQPWHTYVPEHEYKQDSAIDTLAEYQQQEHQLLAEIRQYAELAPQPGAISRYVRGSISNPLDYQHNWNRTFILPGRPGGPAALLVHGLSDSPFSLRALGLSLQARGYTVVGLRLPGHGTVPGALTRLRWQDAAAAVRLAMRDLARRHSRIDYIGYSTGATLGCEYQLARLAGEALPPIASLTLISPALAVTQSAGYAKYTRLLAPLSGIGAAAWSELAPEYDPYKYNSFPFNAAVQIDELTRRVQSGLAGQDLQGWPPTQAYLTSVDDTVLAAPVASILFERLPAGPHQLWVYDLNRYQPFQPLLNLPRAQWALNWFDHPSAKPYLRVLISNRSAPTAQQLWRESRQGAGPVSRTPLNVSWPAQLYALSHVALPFAPNDPVVGIPDAAQLQSGQYLVQLLQGERGVLKVHGNQLLRLRHNPFYAVQEAAVLDFLARH